MPEEPQVDPSAQADPVADATPTAEISAEDQQLQAAIKAVDQDLPFHMREENRVRVQDATVGAEETADDATNDNDVPADEAQDSEVGEQPRTTRRQPSREMRERIRKETIEEYRPQWESERQAREKVEADLSDVQRRDQERREALVQKATAHIGDEAELRRLEQQVIEYDEDDYHDDAQETAYKDAKTKLRSMRQSRSVAADLAEVIDYGLRQNIASDYAQAAAMLPQEHHEAIRTADTGKVLSTTTEIALGVGFQRGYAKASEKLAGEMEALKKAHDEELAARDAEMAQWQGRAVARSKPIAVGGSSGKFTAGSGELFGEDGYPTDEAIKRGKSGALSQ